MGWTRYPEEQRRILELLVESVQVTKKQVEISFRSNGIERIVDELKPMVENGNGKKTKPTRERTAYFRVEMQRPVGVNQRVILLGAKL